MQFDPNKPLTGYQCAQTDDRYLELRLNLNEAELKRIDEHLKKIGVDEYGQFLTAECNKLVDNF